LPSPLVVLIHHIHIHIHIITIISWDAVQIKPPFCLHLSQIFLPTKKAKRGEEDKEDKGGEEGGSTFAA